MYQSHQITGKITKIKDAKTITTKAGKVMIHQSMDVLQHVDNLNEVPRRFEIQSKYNADFMHLKVGDHVRLFFTMSTINNNKGYPATYFNAYKVEYVDAPDTSRAGNSQPEYTNSNIPKH